MAAIVVNSLFLLTFYKNIGHWQNCVSADQVTVCRGRAYSSELCWGCQILHKKCRAKKQPADTGWDGPYCALEGVRPAAVVDQAPKVDCSRVCVCPMLIGFVAGLRAVRLLELVNVAHAEERRVLPRVLHHDRAVGGRAVGKWRAVGKRPGPVVGMPAFVDQVETQV